MRIPGHFSAFSRRPRAAGGRRPAAAGPDAVSFWQVTGILPLTSPRRWITLPLYSAGPPARACRSRPVPPSAKPAAPRAVILGRAGYDLNSAEPGVPLDRVRRFRSGLGGSSANIAVGLARLGWRVSLAAALPPDALGRFVRQRLAAEGIRLAALQSAPERSISLCLTGIVPPDDAEQVFYRCRPADAALRWTPALAAAIRAARGGVFLTNGTSLCALPSRATTRRGLRLARAAGLTTVLDVDYRSSSWPSLAAAGRAAWKILPMVEMLFANEQEARGLALAAGEPAKEAARGSAAGGGAAVARAALARGVRVVVLKQGARGAVAYTAAGRCHASAAATPVHSTVGAGDGFAAGFLDAYGRGRPLAECLLRGNACAAWVVARPGCAEAMPRAAQLARVLGASAPPAAPPSPLPLAAWAEPPDTRDSRAAGSGRQLSASRHS